MDIITIIGFVIGLGLLYFGASQGGGLGVFINAHGLALVVGGTFAMVLVNTSGQALVNTFRVCVRLFFPARQEAIPRVIVILRQVSEQSKSQGIMALQAVDKRLANGFLAHAAHVAVLSGDADFTRNTLEEDILQMRLRHQTVNNVLRTAGVLSPMVGLLGTLIGIVNVLQQISDPSKVGPAMAVALSTAFYGIFIAAFFAVPVAGKLRDRTNHETIIRQLILEGVIGILKNEPAYLLELRLRSFTRNKGVPTMSAPMPGAKVA